MRPVGGVIAARSRDGDDAAVGAGQPHGAAARRHNGGREAGVHPAGEDTQHDVQRVGIGDAETVDRPLRDPDPGHLRVDFSTSSVHDDERPCRGDGADGSRQLAQPACVFEQLAAEFDHVQPRP